MLKSLRNKKAGSPPIVILTILVLVLYTTTLFSFIRSSGKIVAELESPIFLVNPAYAPEEALRFHVSEIGQETLIKTYIEFTQNKEYTYIQNPQSIENNAFFDVINPNLNESFSQRFIENLNSDINKFNFGDDENLNKIKSYTKTGKFDGENYFLSVVGYNQEQINPEKVSIKYSPEIRLTYSLNNYGLDSFEEVYQAKETCKKLIEGVLDCFVDTLPNFMVSYTELTLKDGKHDSLTLTSKRSFLIDGELKKVSFSFLF